MLELNKLYNMDCVEGMKLLDDNSIDSIVTDPPYELGFMGKKWDSTGIAYNVELWKECLRVLKPGGHMLVAGIGRTHHRVMVAIEDSGFEIRDCIYHLFGSGFPKSRNLKQDVERRWKCKLEKLNVSNVERCFYQSIGLNETDGQNIVVENVWELVKEGEKLENVSIVAKNSTFLQRELEEKIGENKALFVLWSVKRSGKSNLLMSLILTGEAGSSSETTDMWLLTSTESIDLNTLSLLNKLSEGELDQTRMSITLTELEQITGLKIWNSLLYQNMLKNIETLSHTALKPAAEIWVLCRKPISEKTIAENVMKWGTGGLNIDDCRVEYDMTDTNPATNPLYRKKNGYKTNYGIDSNPSAYTLKKQEGTMNINNQGRFPANVIFDEEAGRMLDEQHKGASRFFYCAKASKKERNMGLEDMPEVISNDGRDETLASGNMPHNRGNVPKKNHHPTVKPVKLIEYLITLVTPPNGIVLDPFFGSGTTGIAAVNLGFNYIGFEISEEYCKIAEKRVSELEAQETNLLG